MRGGARPALARQRRDCAVHARECARCASVTALSVAPRRRARRAAATQCAHGARALIRVQRYARTAARTLRCAARAVVRDVFAARANQLIDAPPFYRLRRHAICLIFAADADRRSSGASCRPRERCCARAA